MWRKAFHCLKGPSRIFEGFLLFLALVVPLQPSLSAGEGAGSQFAPGSASPAASIAPRGASDLSLALEARRRACQLDAFLAGRLPPTVDPAAVGVVDLESSLGWPGPRVRRLLLLAPGQQQAQTGEGAESIARLADDPGEAGAMALSPEAGLALPAADCSAEADEWLRDWFLLGFTAGVPATDFTTLLLADALDNLDRAQAACLEASGEQLSRAWAVWGARRLESGIAPSTRPWSVHHKNLDALSVFLAGALPVTDQPPDVRVLPLLDPVLNPLLVTHSWERLSGEIGVPHSHAQAFWLRAGMSGAQWQGRIDEHFQGREKRRQILPRVNHLASKIGATRKAMVAVWAELRRLSAPAAEAHKAAQLQLAADVAAAEAEQAAERKAREEAEEKRASEAQTDAAIVQVDQEARQAQQNAAAALQRKVEAESRAREAADDISRKAEEEKALLLDLLAGAAILESEFQEIRRGARQRMSELSDWEKKIHEARDALNIGGLTFADADVLFDELMASLDVGRSAFSEHVAGAWSFSTRVKPVVFSLDISLLDDRTRDEIRALRLEVLDAHERASTVERLAHEESGDSWYKYVVTLDSLRISMLEHISEDKLSQIKGMTSAGLDQVSGALLQLAAVLQHRIQSVPSWLAQAMDYAGSDPLGFTWSLLVIVLFLALFFWWRRRGVDMLEQVGATNPEEHEAHGLGRSLSRYARLVHRPASWLLLLVLLDWWIVADSAIELNAILSIAYWLIASVAVIRFANGAFESYLSYYHLPDSTALLRQKSLKLFGYTVAVGLLLLQLADGLLGSGVVYAWLLNLWLVSLVVVLAVLVVWWKEASLKRYRSRYQSGSVAVWVASRTGGPGGWLAAVLAESRLLVGGLGRWLLHMSSRFRLTRRIHALLFRFQVARLARQRRQVTLSPLSPEAAAAVLLGGCCEPISADASGDVSGPSHVTGPANGAVVSRRSSSMTPLVDKAATDLMDMLARPGVRMAVLVGDRGIGKTTVLDHVARVWSQPVMRLHCLSGDSDDLLAQLARELGQADGSADEAELMQVLCDRGIGLVLVDDVQRLVKPVIDGTKALQRVNSWMRATTRGGPKWVLAMGVHSWRFLRRLSGDKPVADGVVEIPPWEEECISAFLSARTESAGLNPSYEYLALEQAELGGLGGSSSAHSKQWYHRLLWDFSDGNPAVSLHFWVQSLQVDEAGNVHVLPFSPPKAAQVEGLPLDYLFILRALVQMERVCPQVLIEVTRMSMLDIIDALRRLEAMGIVESSNDTFAITLHWRQTVIVTLTRQHLLSVA